MWVMQICDQPRLWSPILGEESKLIVHNWTVALEFDEAGLVVSGATFGRTNTNETLASWKLQSGSNTGSSWIQWKLVRRLANKTYLNHEFEGASCIGIAANNSDYVHIADAHVQKRAASYLSHWTCTQIFCLHNVGAKSIHHVASAYIR